MHRLNRVFWEGVSKRYSAYFNEPSRVIEFGSQYINGSIRDYFKCGFYIGVDWRAGKFVDLVCLTHETPFATESFDTIVSASMLEHDPYWQKSLDKMISLMKPNGILVLSWGAFFNPIHERESSPDGKFHALPAGMVIQYLANRGLYIHEFRYEWLLDNKSPKDDMGEVGLVAFKDKQYANAPRILDYLLKEDRELKDKTVDILIPNYNGFKALELCIESIKLFTTYKPYRIIVYDDGSGYSDDINYLKICEQKGWITLIEGKVNQGHGVALNKLLHDYCTADYAIIIDNDCYVKDYGWLEDMIQAVDGGSRTLGVCDSSGKGFIPQRYIAPKYRFWFGLLKMSAYKDGMQVDWCGRIEDRRKEPFLSMFAEYYPVEQNKEYQDYLNAPNTKWGFNQFHEDEVLLDPGAPLCIKVMTDNPKGYQVVPYPTSVREKFSHFGHGNILLNPKIHAQLTNTDTWFIEWKRIEAEIEEGLKVVRR